MTNNSIKFITKQNSLNFNEQVTSVLNSESKPNLNSNNGKEMKNRKKRRKGEEGLVAQRAHVGPASRPRLPQPPTRPAPPAAATTWARASAAHRSPARSSSLRRSRCQRTPPVSHSLLIFPMPRPTISRPEADSECRAGQGVTPEPWPCPPLAQRPRQRHANHPRPASRSMRSARSLAVRRGARSIGYKSPSLEP
jgi:hypothetical protein